jgi:hypothetical protein
LLCPSDIRVQGELLKLLKRMYKLWGEVIHGPLSLKYLVPNQAFAALPSSSQRTPPPPKP